MTDETTWLSRLAVGHPSSLEPRPKPGTTVPEMKLVTADDEEVVLEVTVVVVGVVAVKPMWCFSDEEDVWGTELGDVMMMLFEEQELPCIPVYDRDCSMDFFVKPEQRLCSPRMYCWCCTGNIAQRMFVVFTAGELLRRQQSNPIDFGNGNIGDSLLSLWRLQAFSREDQFSMIESTQSLRDFARDSRPQEVLLFMANQFPASLLRKKISCSLSLSIVVTSIFPLSNYLFKSRLGQKKDQLMLVNLLKKVCL